MLVDLILLALLAWWVARGYASGALAQLCRWSGLALGQAVSRPLALILTMMMAPRLGIPPVGARVALSLLCFCTFYVVGTLLAGFLLRRFVRRGKHTALDRAAGGLLAAGSGALAMLVLLSGLLFFEAPLSRALPRRPPAWLGGSTALAWVRRADLNHAARLGTLAKLQHLAEAVRAPQAEQDARLRRLAADPGLATCLQDERLFLAIKTGDWPSLSRDPRIAAILQDPRFAASLGDPLDYDGEN